MVETQSGMPKTAGWLIGSCALLFSCGAHANELSTTRAPNIILVVCDNLGYGDIEPFGSQLNRTPHLSRMASEGRRFTHFCVTAGVCTPSRASIMTGKYAQRVGMHTNPRDGQVLRPVSPFGLSPAELTVAENLKSQGYATAMIGKWHLGDQSKFLPTRQGFDSFFGIPYSDDMTREVGLRISKRAGDRLAGKTWPPLPLLQNEKVIEAPVDRNTLTKRYTERALNYIREHRDAPFFLYIAQAMPGSTSQPFSSARFRGKSKGGPWGDSVEELDWSMGEILNELKHLALDKNTLVIWTSDNGAPLNAKAATNPRGSNGDLHGRGYTTSEGAFRVPMIAWWPGNVPAASTCGQLCTTMDLLPTFANLASGKDGIVSQLQVDGHDISELLLDDSSRSKSPYDFFYYYDQDQLQAVRSGKWKLFLQLENWTKHPHFKKGEATQVLLFDLQNDPACERNVADSNPDEVARLLGAANVARAELGDRGVLGSGQKSPGNILGTPIPLTVAK